MPLAQPLDAGFHNDILEEDYHADPCPEPSLSHSIAKVLFERSPAHARLQHPRLNPDFTRDRKDPTRPMLRGSAAHKMLLGKGAEVHVLAFDDFKTKDAQRRRDDAFAAGAIPLLEKDFETVEAMVATGKTLIANHPRCQGFFDDGDAEVTMVWKQDGDIWCRSRIDRFPAAARKGGHITLFDLKTTSGSAHPEDYQRTFFDVGNDTQGPFYEYGLRTLIPNVQSVRFVYIVQEQEAPFAVQVYELGGQADQEAREAMEVAFELWRTCMRTKSWPAYGDQVSYIDPPKYASMSREMKKMRLQERLSKWQAPLNLDHTRAA